MNQPLGADWPDLLTVEEVASILRHHHQTIRDMIRAGKLPAIRTGTGRRHIRVTAAALREWVLNGGSTAPAPAEQPKPSAPDLRLTTASDYADLLRLNDAGRKPEPREASNVVPIRKRRKRGG